MSSTDKALVYAVIVTLTFFAGMSALEMYYEQRMGQIAADSHAKEWQLKVELEQAKAEQMRYRALELGYLCQFVDKTGEVYLSEGCE